MEYTLKKLGSIKSIKLPERKFKGRDMDEKNKTQGKKRRRKKKLHILRKIFVALIGLGLLCMFLGHLPLLVSTLDRRHLLQR